MADVASIFANQKPPQGLAGMSLGDLINVARGAQQLGSEQALGGIVQKNTDPETGDLNFSGASKDSAAGPQFGAAERLHKMIELQSAQQAKNRDAADYLQTKIGAAITNPTEANINSAFMLAHKVMGPSASYTALRQAYDALPTAAAKKSFLADMNNQMQGIGGTIPAIPTISEKGRPILTTPAAAAREAAGAPGSETVPGRQPQQPAAATAPTAPRGSMVAGPEAGSVEAQSIGAKGAAEAVNSLHAAADNVPNTRALLDNLQALSSHAGTGPTTDLEQKLNSAYLRAFPGENGPTMSAKDLAATEKFGKYAEQIAGQQAGQVHATDSFLSNAYKSNPSLLMSKIGREGVIKVLNGNNDAIEAQRGAWLDYKNGLTDGREHTEKEYRDWLHKFNRGYDFRTGKPDAGAQFDPRVFQYARLSPEERVEFRREMIPKDQMKTFAAKLGKATERGWINLGQ